MITDEQIILTLTERFQTKNMESKLDQGRFKSLFRDAVKDYYPKLKAEYADQHIYGISFEIGDVVQLVYYNNFETYVYFNTEEMYSENIKDCGDDERSYYRFEPMAEWEITTAETTLFQELRDYLELNSLYESSVCSSAEYADKLGKETVEWFEENESELEDAFDFECEQIRLWIADVLCGLRQEGFWKEQGNENMLVIPFSGECDITIEEMISTFKLMDMGCNGTEYTDYLKSCYE